MVDFTPLKSTGQGIPNASTSQNKILPKQNASKIGQSTGDRYNYVFRIKIGGTSQSQSSTTSIPSLPSTSSSNSPITADPLYFELSKGEILGIPIVYLSRRYYSYTEFVLNDPKGEILKQLKNLSNVEVEIGYPGQKIENKFVGVIYNYGRKQPNGTYVLAVDQSALIQQSNSQISDSQTQQTDTSQTDTSQNTSSFQQGDLITDINQFIENLSKQNANGQKYQPFFESVLNNAKSLDGTTHLKNVDNSKITLNEVGKIKFSDKTLNIAAQEAATTGTNISVRGNTISLNAPGTEPDSGVIENLG